MYKEKLNPHPASPEEKGVYSIQPKIV